ncbi:MAG: PASTA domain-containing protein [Gemmatimonadales bacterium]|nr:MAG: PASTA domain-containing protein [Gemmatimonadales bacterium]
MKLGSSIRRRRGGGPPPPAKKGRGGSHTGGSSGKGRSGVGRTSRFGQIVLLALVVGLLGSGGGYLWATQVVFPAGERDAVEFFRVPDLRGMAMAEARQALIGAGLEVGRVDSIQHPQMTEGRVVGQSPLPGQLGLPGGEVEFSVSLGPERRPVPDVSRLVASRAVTVLETTGFQVQIDSVEADLEAGRVVETVPAAGEEVVVPTDVILRVSLGPPLVQIPVLVGLQEEQALAMLDSLGLLVGEIQPRFRFGFNQGEVLGQHPEAGQEVPQGSLVRLEVGRRGLFRDPDQN